MFVTSHLSSISTFNCCSMFQPFLFDKTIITNLRIYNFLSWFSKFYENQYFWRKRFVILSIHKPYLGSCKVPQKIWAILMRLKNLQGHQVVCNVTQTLSIMWDNNVFGKNKINLFCIQGSLFKPKEDTAKRDAQLGFVEIRMMLDKRLVSISYSGTKKLWNIKTTDRLKLWF